MIVTYRRAVPGDAARLAAFATESFTSTYAEYNTPEDMRDYLAASYGLEQQTRELTDPAMTTLLAESVDAVVGYSQVRRNAAPACVPQEAPAEIYRFYVSVAAHGTGVAQRLMAASLAAARELGATHVWLGVWERNPRAIAFYRKSGFREVGTQYFQLGSDRQRDLVVMREVP